MNDFKDTSIAEELEASPQPVKVKRLVGFAAMNPEEQKALARKGQAALVASGKRHTWTTEQAREAARIGWARRRGTGA